MSAELALAVVALAASLGSLGVVLVLSLTKRLDYISRKDLETTQASYDAEMARVKASMSKLWRYVEAVDEQSGGTGYRVLGWHVPGDDTPARKR